MSANATRHICPHCQEPLVRFRMPDESGWDDPVQLVCFNDDCPYYRDGWDWMRQTYRVNASYRFSLVDAEKGTASPLAVWSPEALRNLIIAEPEDEPNATGGT